MRTAAFQVLLAFAVLPARAAVPTAAILERWGVPLERYAALPAESRAQLAADLEIAEKTRLRRLELIRELRPADWSSFVDAKGFLTKDGLRIVEAHEAAERARGLRVPVVAGVERADGKPLAPEDLARVREVMNRIFDGMGALDPASAPEGTELVFDARVRNETVRSVTVTNPKTGLSFEVGQLGIDGRSPLLAPSPYLNLSKSWESGADSWVDYRVRAQVAWVDLKARFFADGPDPRVGRMLDLAGSLGAPQSELDRLRGHLTYDDAYRAQNLVVTSLLAQVGRSYRLFGPVDVGWSVTSLTKIMHLAPNQAFDESLGIRVKLPGEDLFFGLFGGVTQNISPVGNRLYQELMTTGTVEPGFHLEQSPHWTAKMWGKVPGLEDARFSLSAGQRLNRDTTVNQAEAALLTSFGRVPVAVRATYSRERGDAIEFDREKARLQLDAQLTDRITGYLAAEREKIRYGNAELDSNAVLAGVTIDLDGGRRASRLTVDHLFGPEYGDKKTPLREHLPEATRRVTETLAGGLEAAAEAADLAALLERAPTQAQIDAALNRLSLALSRTSPEAASALLSELAARAPLSEEQRRLIADALTRVVPTASDRYAELRRIVGSQLGPEIARWLDRARAEAGSRADLLEEIRGKARDAAALLRLVADEDSWRAVAVSAGRAALLESLSRGQQIEVPVLDKTITLKTHAPVFIAAMGAINSRLSPLAPVRAGDAEPWLLRMAADQLGMPEGPVSSEMIAGRLIAMGQERLDAELDGRLAPAIDRLVASGAYDPARIAGEALGALPPAAAEALRQRYGANLEGLLPAAGSPEELRRFVSERLAGVLGDALRRELADDAARAVAEMASWAGEILRRELNLATIHMMLAAEELDRLTVDRGRKASDLGVEMIGRSFARLDERRRREASRQVHRARTDAFARFAEDEARLAARLADHGRRRLDALTLDPAWPQGLVVTASDEALAAILASYGDARFFALLERLAERRRASGRAAPLAVAFEFDANPALGGTSIWKLKDGGRRVVLGPARDPREASLRLTHLEKTILD
jgi:hypothetical protein